MRAAGAAACVVIVLCFLGHFLLTYAPEKLHQYRVREVRPAWQVAVARAAEGVGRVRQARKRTFHVQKKDAVAFRVKTGETCVGMRRCHWSC